MADTKKSAPLNDKIAEALLDRLGTDDEFREKFRADPMAALTSIGYEPQEVSAADSDEAVVEPFSACDVNVLASKEDILAARKELFDTLTQGLSYNTPTFEAATLDRRTLK